MRLFSLILVGVVPLALSCSEQAGGGPASPELRQLAKTATPLLTSQPAQAVAVAPDASVQPIVTTGDPLSGATNPDPTYNAWAPIPDGIGAYKKGNDLVVYVNHELSAAGVNNEFTYSRVSRLVLDIPSLAVRSADYPLTGSALLERLCSATWVDSEEGFAPGFFLTGEEASSSPTQTTVALDADGTITDLPWLGRYAHENTIAVPGFAGRVVLIGLDDTAGKSELYMYVAENAQKVLAGEGKLFVFSATGSGVSHAGNLAVGQSVIGKFVEITDPAAPAAELQTEAVAVGAFPFVRLEDGDYDKAAKINGLDDPTIYFVDTGSASVAVCGGSGTEICDLAGSVYRMLLNGSDPTQGAKLTLLARSPGAANGWASPDNVGTSRSGIMVQEDPAYPGFKRAPKIWYFPITGGELGAPAAVVELQGNPGCDESSTAAQQAANPSLICWETSGIVSTEEWLGAGTWLFDVQAHGLPFTYQGASGPINVSRDGGQLLLLNAPGT